MRADIYHDMVKFQKHHWWFKARKKILRSLLGSLINSDKNNILEIGCGIGNNILMLGEFGDVTAVEMDEFAAKYAAQETGVDVKIGCLPDNIPFQKHFDIVCLFDVLEHIEKDIAALKKVKDLLNAKGVLIITVPAHKWLFGRHDEMHHHFRRYSKKEILEKFKLIEMKSVRLTHFNFILFPGLVVARLADFLLNNKNSIGYSIPNYMINNLLFLIFGFERFFLSIINVQFGGSLFVFAKKIKIK